MELTGEILPAPFLFAQCGDGMTYLELLQRALAVEIEATRLYLACMALAPREDLGVLLEINKDETDHVALISSLISRQTGRDADYAAMVRGVD